MSRATEIMLAAFLALVLLSGPLPAQEGPAQKTIAAQIDAFLADDFDTAFAYASPGIQRYFGTPERFGEMVRQGYPMVHRPGDVRYLDARPEGARVIQRVLIRDQGGAFHVLEYEMMDAGDAWVIDGVRLIEAPQTGA